MTHNTYIHSPSSGQFYEKGENQANRQEDKYANCVHSVFLRMVAQQAQGVTVRTLQLSMYAFRGVISMHAAVMI